MAPLRTGRRGPAPAPRVRRDTVGHREVLVSPDIDMVIGRATLRFARKEGRTEMLSLIEGEVG
jgi:hypothetical protein